MEQKFSVDENKLMSKIPDEQNINTGINTTIKRFRTISSLATIHTVV